MLMRRWMPLVATIVVLGSVTLGSLPRINPQDPQDPESKSRRDLMRTKLNFSKALMEGLSLHNFELIRTAATDIRNVTESEMWLVSDKPEYNHYSDELKISVERLIRAAELQNMEACTLRFFEMTIKCIDCHDYLRQNRL